jgi:hypothetical protein
VAQREKSGINSRAIDSLNAIGGAALKIIRELEKNLKIIMSI